MNDHYALFQNLIAALQAYVVLVNTDSDLTNDVAILYVTGHSLGAAMVQAFMEDWTTGELAWQWAGIRAEAVTLASPGYGSHDIFADDRIANFWNDNDPILGATWFGSNEGYKTKIFHNLAEGVNLADKDSIHSMALYNGFVRFFLAQGIDLCALNSADNPGQHFASIYTNVRVINEKAQVFLIGVDADILIGNRHENLMLGGEADDELYGNGGGDRLLGGSDWDKLYGGPGSDTIEGGYGYDEMWGNGGKDYFVFNDVEETNSQGQVVLANIDKIMNFDTVLWDDVIDLSLIDANWRREGNQEFVFKGSAAFTGARGELRFDPLTLTLSGDCTGDGTAEFRIVVYGATSLTLDNFIL